ncbi:hypothetical protein Ddc_18150 [Ditylenchus destructor]|nr:hypothetical protein Ddc_18150 [Ditylenchus destructor]
MLSSAYISIIIGLTLVTISHGKYVPMGFIDIECLETFRPQMDEKCNVLLPYSNQHLDEYCRKLQSVYECRFDKIFGVCGESTARYYVKNTSLNLPAEATSKYAADDGWGTVKKYYNHPSCVQLIDFYDRGLSIMPLANFMGVAFAVCMLVGIQLLQLAN